MSLPPGCAAPARHHLAQAPIFEPVFSVPAAGSPVAAAAAAVAAATLSESPPPPPLPHEQLPERPRTSQAGHPRATTRSPAAMATAANDRHASVRGGGIHKPKQPPAPAPAAGPGPGQDAAAADSCDDGDGPTAEQRRRQRFLERNRIAASKCRQKKKMWVQELERRAEEVTMQNRTLHIAIVQLKEEVMVLKNQLLAHRNCTCSAIHQYLQADRAAAAAAAAAEIVPAAVPLPPPGPGPGPSQALLPPAPPPPPAPAAAHHHANPAVAAAAAAVAAAAVGNAVTAAAAGPALLLQTQAQAQAQTAFIIQQQQQHVRGPQTFNPQMPHHPHMSAAGGPNSAAAVPGAFGVGPRP
ncbi:hypothetical protein H4R18_000901 [Coemansia javaensis]|uniref:BZIP domain-containing protein n=1 Tax=Coemansia javaensis TaxID=2761396 RepID=A0A9W8LJX4_9FUNG|nr:hypothetical protein H4R18_000901 [Coemansia javaensis]